MDNIDDSENNAKISDSAYSNSCSNSQSRRSHSSKSTHSGSHSSGSSGYGGKPSTTGSSNAFSQPPKKDKESNKKKQSQSEPKTEAVAATEDPCGAPEPEADVVMPLEEPLPKNVDEMPPMDVQPQEDEKMDISTSAPASPKEEVKMVLQPGGSLQYVTSRPISSCSTEGFSCVISMHDGVVMYTTSNITATLGFPKDMWIGRSFIDFVHLKDRSTFASQITNGLAVPKVVNGTQYKAQNAIAESTMVCRIRRYRGLAGGFGVKERAVTFMPFMLKLSFKNITDEDKVTYLVIQATPFFSAFKIPMEVMVSSKPFVIRHSATGSLDYIDPESVPYLGYLPQDIQDMDALKLYHDDDLPYLRNVYEKIVKEGTVAKSTQYRMKTQNGDYLKVETEWSSFINPWSMKLEFVIGKHYIVEGPNNPDVFQSTDLNKPVKVSEEDRNKAQGLRDSIVKIMNEVLTKPAELAKQCLSKRCQDLAIIMENLIAEQPKSDDELRLDLHEPDNNYYERDSVMLGGISPHHEYNDSKSSTETPLSYNQLNYNENLQRYFDSHQTDTFEYSTYQTVGLHEPSIKANTTKCGSPPAMVQDSGDSFDMSSCASSKSMKIDATTSSNSALGDYNPVRLTEQLLNKHNSEMEKKLVMMRRESRSSTKGDREKATNEKRQKKKEHLARCNASFQPTLAGLPPEFLAPYEPHGTKRTKPLDTDAIKSCPLRKTRRRRTTSPPNDSSSPAVMTTTVATKWSNTTGNTFILGVGVPPHVPLLSPVPAMHGVFPMYYTPAMGQAPSTTTNAAHMPSTSAQPFQATMPCMMYGHHVYGQPFMYSPINAQVSYPPPHQMGSSIQYTGMIKPVSLASCEEAINSSLSLNSCVPLGAWKDKTRQDALAQTAKSDQYRGNNSTNALNRSAEATLDRFTSPSNSKATKASEGTPDRTDGESSYSSFYSSFFKTDSGSAEDSGDQNKKSNTKKVTNTEKPEAKKPLHRKMEPPWMDQVCVTSELIYKYQILTKSVNEVLESDKQKMLSFQQPSLVNEQLEQLYLDLQLEGVAARLTLEEGITSSSSSGEENSTSNPSNQRRKREHSKLVMIYEEDASLPSPRDTELEESATTVS